MKRFLCLLLTSFFAVNGLAQVTNETRAQFDARMKWFHDARFGLFIHWGLYSELAGEWNGRPAPSAGEWIMENARIPTSQYEQITNRFNPVKFDAKEWVRIAKGAGMKYIVITSKHHDGFGLFRSDLTDWCIKCTPFQRDPLKELADACSDAGLTFCFYHSIMDWHHPDYPQRRAWNDTAKGAPAMDRYVAFMKGELKELLMRYGPLGILWFDGEWEAPWTHDRGVDLYNYVRSLQPQIIVNNRVGKARAGMSGMDQGSERIGDYGTPEQEIPGQGFGPGVYWESCMTMNNTWGYRKDDNNWKSAQMLVRNLIDCASKGGNYLLNVGPTGEGLIPGASIERLTEVGQWMQVNSEAIYGTEASPFNRLAWGRATQKSGKLYLHVFDWPDDGKLNVPLMNKVNKAYVLANRGTELKFEKTSAGLLVQVPAASPTPHAGVVVLEIEGKPEVAEVRIPQAADGTLALRAVDADLVGRTIRLETKGNGPPNIGYWTDANDRIEWPVTVSKPGMFDVQGTWACDPASAGSECVMTVQGQRLSGKVDATESWEDFVTRVVGRIEITNAGPATITISVAKKPGLAVVNLREVRLVPAQ